MAIEVVSTGEKHKIKVECTLCGSVLKLTSRDCTLNTRKEEDRFEFNCPVCNEVNYVPKEAFDEEVNRIRSD